MIVMEISRSKRKRMIILSPSDEISDEETGNSEESTESNDQDQDDKGEFQESSDEDREFYRSGKENLKHRY